ncbi:MAG: hypothetical protein AAF328_07975 [Planctomycetota bacterium]
MSKALVLDELCSFVESERPAPQSVGPQGGRPAVTNRQTFTCIMFVLKHSLSWQAIPAELNCGSGLGVIRYVVERTSSWFNHFRRLRQCNERWGTHFQAFHDLAATLICHQRLVKQRDGL